MPAATSGFIIDWEVVGTVTLPLPGGIIDCLLRGGPHWWRLLSAADLATALSNIPLWSWGLGDVHQRIFDSSFLFQTRSDFNNFDPLPQSPLTSHVPIRGQ